MRQMDDGASAMERGSGIALWRQIADCIRHGIAEGSFIEGSRLPPEFTLAERFGVNRHTVRAAIAALVQEGVLRAEQGRGTYVERAQRFSYAVGRRTRFSDNLKRQSREQHGHLLASSFENADARIAKALEIAPGTKLLRLEVLSEVDRRPLSRATHWFDAARFPAMAENFAETRSITAAFAAQGVTDYLRRSTIVSARHADGTSLAELKLSPGAIVLQSVAVNEDLEGHAIQYSVTLFAADRVELAIG